ncbi:MAG: hypothetical protein A3G32_03235 [Deltaproteobacteria bacterium RIFCSPLOWO2_12_FULL_40_28]|nr:MAG: hypothetical protein A3C45_01920 [Deltaproteobacteria bacterium RIFCSPHIGHO2_02_FULL_40_28]OGQ20112.1 MAG: hypothetical protein A3E27_01215 [Deltaproteobacteria bacterium RIFCSPHIGHO2_12_FULL_40_32]OGQ40683.1 MAG: hypothetical protein A3I69_02480 [Deltaproteobacteria bacterium RIFCSPLOWO2_02_FULL_40_36]OGQ54378.1 MAG: hypothetical protein A3G32_03235 [Deltaproteobacteria bacterium RIFCSPLOWO2_12_FULL_40_28]
MKHLRAQIVATGSYVPSRVVPNSELEVSLHTTNEWIRSKIGIKERRYAEPDIGPADLALHAAIQALKTANREARDIDCILFATTTPEYEAPGSGVLLQDKLGCRRIPAFDVHNTSPGFLFALELGDSLIRSGKYECILVAAGEVLSPRLDMTEAGRLMSVIFGDGAGCVLLEATEGPHGILATKLHSDGVHYNKLWCEGPHTYPTMDGPFVFKHAVTSMSLVAKEILIEQGIESNQLTHIIPHQANLRIIETIADQLKIPMAKVKTTIQKYGNTSAASIPITLDETVRAGLVKPNDLILTMSFGSGFSWGAGLIRW